MKADWKALSQSFGFHGMVYSNGFTLDRTSPYAF
jgi:hypothetical protein